MECFRKTILFSFRMSNEKGKKEERERKNASKKKEKMKEGKNE